MNYKPKRKRLLSWLSLLLLLASFFSLTVAAAEVTEPAETVQETEIHEEEPVSDDGIFPVSVPVKARVQTVGLSSAAGYSFAMEAGENPGGGLALPDVTTVSSTADGTIPFEDVSIGAAGTYTVLLTQNKPDAGDVKGDGRTFTLTITVSESGSVDASYASSTGSGQEAVFVTTTTKSHTFSRDTMNKAKAYMDGMTLEQKVGQCFLVHYSDKTYTDPDAEAAYANNMISKYQPGGIVVFKWNAQYQTPAAFKAKIAASAKKASTPLIWSVDEEGGNVVRFSGLTDYRSSAFASPQALKASGGLDAVKTDTKEKAAFLKDLDMNTNLAPVADVATSGYIAARTYGGDGVENAGYVETVVKEAADNGLGSSLKHFPGYGGTSSNTHEGFAINSLSMEELLYNDLLPFRAGIAAGNPMLMVTHNTYEAIDAENPASLSPAVYKLAREELGFSGLIITDDLGMKAITDFSGSVNASTRALLAGADMALTANPAGEIPATIARVKDGTLPESLIDEHVLRILCYKIDQGLLTVDTASFAAKYLDVSGKELASGSFLAMFRRAQASGGTVKLYQDITLSTLESDGSSVYDAKTQNITLDLNGHDIDYRGPDGTSDKRLAIFTTWDGGSFTLTDSSAAITEEIISGNGVESTSGSAYKNGILTYWKEGESIRRRVDFNQCYVGRINLSGRRYVEAFVCSGGTFSMKNGILANSMGRFVQSGNTNTMTISGGALLMDACAESSIFQSRTGSNTLTISGGYFLGNASDAGSDTYAVYADKTVISGHPVFAANQAVVTGSTVSVSGDALFLGNTHDIYGGTVTVSGNAVFAGGADSRFLAGGNFTLGGNAVFSGKSHTAALFDSTGTITIKEDVSIKQVTRVQNTSFGLIRANSIIMQGNASVKDCSSDSNGVLYAENKVTLSGNASITGCRAHIGSAVYTKDLDIGGTVSVKDNNAVSYAAIYASGAVKISGSPVITGNTANMLGAGLFLRGGASLSGSPKFYGNCSRASMMDGVYLPAGCKFTLSGALAPDMRLQVLPGSGADEIPVVTDGSGLTASAEGYFESSLSTHKPAVKNGGMYLVKTDPVQVPVTVLANGKPYTMGTSVLYYRDGCWCIKQSDAFELLNAFGYEFGDKLPDVIGATALDGRIVIPERQFIQDGEETYLALSPDMDETQASYLFLPNSGQPGDITLEEAVKTNGFWSVEVRDVYGIANESEEDVSSFQYVPAGGTLGLELPYHEAPFDWHVYESDENDFNASFTQDEELVTAVIQDIHSPCLIIDGQNKAVTYTVQTYAYVNTLSLGDEPGGAMLPVIDTSGGKLPENSLSQAEKFLQVDETNGNKVKHQTALTSLYKDKTFLYATNPRLSQIEQLGETNGYELSEIWILKDGHNPKSTNPEDFTAYKKTDYPELTSLRKLHLTNNPDYESQDTILIQDGASLRFVYQPVTTTQKKEVSFYDYDVSDGYLYQDAAYTKKKNTSQQRTFTPAYIKTNQQGINHNDNYGAGSKLGFGNANTNSGRADEVYPGTSFFLNKTNKNNIYSGCIFGLVQGLEKSDTGFYPVFADGIAAPNLFEDGREAAGKTKHSGQNLLYEKTGDTYVLSGLEGKLSDLDAFTHPGTKYTHIWTNNFWPMDYVSSWGSDGHDPKWGTPKASDMYNDIRYANSVWSLLPETDDSKNHNPYFGMSFSLNFTLPAGYHGPMEYCFFGDDDVWMFLDGKQVVDIGGVHSSVGQYVNLWDYLEESDTDTEHEIVFFYTERGASGSTCWMEFTIPQLKFGSEAQVPDEGGISVTKEADGAGAVLDTEYGFTVTITDENDKPVSDDFTFRRTDGDGKLINYGILEKGVGSFKVRPGEQCDIIQIPAGYHSLVEEKDYACETEILVDSTETVSGKIQAGEILSQTTRTLHYQNHFDGVVRLPDTGETSLLYLFLIGMTGIVLGCAMLRKTKKP